MMTPFWVCFPNFLSSQILFLYRLALHWLCSCMNFFTGIMILDFLTQRLYHKKQLPRARSYLTPCPEVFCKKGVLKNFTKFTGKHLCQSLFFNNVLINILKKKTPAQVHSNSGGCLCIIIWQEANNLLAYFFYQLKNKWQWVGCNFSDLLKRKVEVIFLGRSWSCYFLKSGSRISLFYQISFLYKSMKNFQATE